MDMKRETEAVTANTTVWVTEKLNDRVYDVIRNKIISHELSPGSRLVDSKLAGNFGISRTPVRDAIRKLASEGLVVADAKKGYYVFSATKQDILEVFEIRLIFEHAIINKLIVELVPNDYQHYCSLIQAIEDKLNEEIARDMMNFALYDAAFHESLTQLANNYQLANLCNGVYMRTKAFRSLLQMNTDRINKSNHLHIMILNKIRNLDLEGTLKASNEHMMISRDEILEKLDTMERK